MAWPSTVSSFTNPAPTDRLNSPSHSSIETAQNTGITELQTFLGTMNASALGTLIGTVYNSSSDGGGHVQSANKGGTGQTSYAKGNILAASSSSVLSKLAPGDDGQVLTADSSVAAGVKWSNATTYSNRVGHSTVSSTAGENITAETSIFSFTVPGSTIGASNVLRTTLYVSDFSSGGATSSVFLNANYGGVTVASIVFGTATPQDSNASKGKVEFTILPRGSVASQKNLLNLSLIPNRLVSPVGFSAGNFGSVAGWVGYTSSVNSIDTSANQVLGMTVRFTNSGVGTKFSYDGFLIEKLF